MSCVNCGQDVPVVPSADDPDTVTCLRCRATFMWTSMERRSLHIDPQHVPRASRVGGKRPSAGPPPLVATDDDWDSMYDPCATWSPERDEQSSSDQQSSLPSQTLSEDRRRRKRRTKSQWVQWLLLMLGVALFTSGAVLIGWSFYEDQQGLWNIGTPLALAGQVIFLIGLILQLDILWQQSKVTARAVEELDDRLPPAVPPQTRHTIPVTRAHGNEANPQRLLHDLKGQLDQFATRLSSHPRI